MPPPPGSPTSITASPTGSVFDRPVLGNSSTAITGGPFWRSLVRDALTRPDGSGPLRLYEGYAANQLYVYPSHLDYGGLARHGRRGGDRPRPGPLPRQHPLCDRLGRLVALGPALPAGA